MHPSVIAAVASSGAGWRPSMASSATLIGWYEVRPDLVTLSGSECSQVSNRIAGGPNPLLQATGTSRPAYSATSWGGTRPGLTFDGTTDVLEGDGLAASVTGTDQPFTVVMAAQILTLGTSVDIRSLWGFGRNGVDPPLHDLRLPASVSGVIGSGRRDDASTSRVKDAATAVDTNRHIYSLTFTGTRVALHIDGVLDANLDGVSTPAADSDVGATTLDTFSVGGIRRIGLSGLTHMVLGGILVYAGALSGAERAEAEHYLKLGHPL
jgi:hypothetical protein